MVSWPEYSKQAKTIRYAYDLVQAIAFVISNEENRDIAMGTTRILGAGDLSAPPGEAARALQGAGPGSGPAAG